MLRKLVSRFKRVVPFTSNTKVKETSDGQLITAIGVIPYVYHLATTNSLTQIDPFVEYHGDTVYLTDTIHGYVAALQLPDYQDNFNKQLLPDVLHPARINDRTYKFHVYRIDTTTIDKSKLTLEEYSDSDHFDKYISGQITHKGSVLNAERIGQVEVKLLTESQHMKKPYVYTIHWVPLYESSMNITNVYPYLPFDLSPVTTNDELNTQMLEHDRQQCYIRYHRYKDILDKNFQKSVQFVHKYLKTHNV